MIHKECAEKIMAIFEDPTKSSDANYRMQAVVALCQESIAAGGDKPPGKPAKKTSTKKAA